MAASDTDFEYFSNADREILIRRVPGKSRLGHDAGVRRES
jgi:hypothetical protein